MAAKLCPPGRIAHSAMLLAIVQARLSFLILSRSSE